MWKNGPYEPSPLDHNRRSYAGVVLADTDRDGVRDDVDRVPLGDAFVEISIDSTYVSGSDPHNAGSVPFPFVKVTIQGNATYTTHPWDRSAAWYTFDDALNRYDGHRLSVNVPDDVAQVSLAVEMWSYDERGYNEHLPIGIARDTSFGGCSDLNKTTIQYALQGMGQSTAYQLSGGCAGSPRYANPLNLTVTTIVPNRIAASLILPNDYAGVYNVTDTGGQTIGRRYAGEPRFVAFLLNETTWEPAFQCYCGPAYSRTVLVPRSVFFESRLYAYLNASNPVAPLNKLAFRQNLTAASSNSDDLQQILTGNVTTADVAAILDLLTRNGKNALVHLSMPLTNDLFLYSLPDGAVRLVGYDPPPTAYSWTYTFSAGTMARPWWELVWTGIIVPVAALFGSGLVLAVTSFLKLVEVLAQVGAWFADLLSGDPVRVERAVKAAQKALDDMVNGLVEAILAIWDSIVKPLTQPIVDAYNAWVNEVGQHILSMQKQSLDIFVRGLIQLTFFSVFALAIFAMIVAFSVAEKITNAMTLGLASVAGIVIGAIAGLIIGMLVVAAISEWLGSTVIEDLLPPGFDDVAGATFTVAQFLFAYELARRPLTPIRGVETALRDAVLGLLILGVSFAIRTIFGESVQGLIALVIVDVIALYLALSGLKDMITISGRGWNLVKMAYPFLYPVTVVMNAISIATPAADLVSDAGKLNRVLAGG